MTRWKASTLHLLLSVFVLGGVALTGLLLWYPHGLYRVAEFDRILFIMFGIDLVAGPLLTLVVYRQAKRELKFDMAVIVLCQVAFFSYGLRALWLARPVFLVASEARANLVFANEIEPGQLALAPRAEWRRFAWLGPQRVGVSPPASDAERQDLLFSFLQSGIDIDRLPRYYVDYNTVVPPLLAGAVPVEGDPRLRRVPLVSRYGVADLVLDATTGEPVGVQPH